MCVRVRMAASVLHLCWLSDSCRSSSPQGARGPDGSVGELGSEGKKVRGPRGQSFIDQFHFFIFFCIMADRTCFIETKRPEALMQH